MRNARTILAIGIAALALAACNKQKAQTSDANMSMDVGVPTNQVTAGNAEIETLPADESSTTPTNELQNGFDNPDVNEIGNSD